MNQANRPALSKVKSWDSSTLKTTRTNRSDSLQGRASIVSIKEHIVGRLFTTDTLHSSYAIALSDSAETLGESIGFDARADIRQVVLRIRKIKAKSEDPDDEDDKLISVAVASRAESLVKALARRVYFEGLRWSVPSVSPTPSGGIHISWRNDEYSVGLTVADHEGSITVVSMRPNEIPVRQTLSFDKAVGSAIRVLKFILNS